MIETSYMTATELVEKYGLEVRSFTTHTVARDLSLNPATAFHAIYQLKKRGLVIEPVTSVYIYAPALTLPDRGVCIFIYKTLKRLLEEKLRSAKPTTRLYVTELAEQLKSIFNVSEGGRKRTTTPPVVNSVVREIITKAAATAGLDLSNMFVQLRRGSDYLIIKSSDEERVRQLLEGVKKLFYLVEAD